MAIRARTVISSEMNSLMIYTADIAGAHHVDNITFVDIYPGL
jgi:hypothetical protein